MRVEELGEFPLIDRLARVLSRHGVSPRVPAAKSGYELLISIGDDAAAWKAPAGLQVFTTDTMVEDIHFERRYTSWTDLGWKALAVNLSDVAAMGCMPLYGVVTLGLPPDTPVEGLEEMYEAMAQETEQHGVGIVGGDIVRSPVFFVTIALLGYSQTGTLLTRSGAKAGDQVAVTGHVGCSAGGLRTLSVELTLDPETKGHLAAAHSRPMARIAEGKLLAEHGVRCAIDLSDGLADDLGKVCVMSGVSAVLYANRVPADGFLKQAFPKEWLSLALGGGEDYELLFTAPPRIMERACANLPTSATVIGEIVSGPPGVEVLDAKGRPVSLAKGGWDHFPR
ncbi:MAG: thiamine-phosphate kinase [SAR202 cluster bacterium]|nr:thiamine-phosphate kinase [SAR202 cluster bacterium]